MAVTDITEKLLYAMISSCTCGTRTPEVEHHAENCLYRLLNEARDKIIELRQDVVYLQDGPEYRPLNCKALMLAKGGDPEETGCLACDRGLDGEPFRCKFGQIREYEVE